MPSSGVKTCARSEEHTSELQSHDNLVCRLLLEKKHNQGSIALIDLVATASAGGPPTYAARARAGDGGRGTATQGGATSRLACNVRFFFMLGAPTRLSPFPPHAALPF